METQFHCGSILEDIYYGYNMREELLPRERARKLTLTEVTDEFDEVLDNDIPEEINAEDAFSALDEGVKEWKSRLEQVVGDGLRKLKKNIKEKRLMVKYIPGTHCGKDELGILNEAKLLAIKSCEHENAQIMSDLSKRVDRIFNIAHPKMKQKAHLAKDVNQNKKKLININCAAGGGLDNFKELLKSIGSLNENSTWTWKNSTIPIYSPNCDTRDRYALVKKGCTEILPAYNRWFFNDIIMNPTITNDSAKKSSSPIRRSINLDFKIKHYNNAIGMEKRVVKPRPIPKAKQTKQKLNKRYEMREFDTKTGVTKIFISKRNERQRSFHDVEDVYSDWIKLIERPRQSVRRPPTLKPVDMGPFLYSEILKRNLYIPPEAPEDIYESWRDFLIAEEQKITHLSSNGRLFKKPARCGSEPEDFFESWKYNFNPALWGYEPIPFMHENIFRSWRRNLFEPKHESKNTNVGGIPENYFSDWLHNFQEKEPSKFSRKSSKRQSRRKRSGKKDNLTQI